MQRATSIFNDGVVCKPLDACPSCRSAGIVLHSDLQDRLFGAPGTWSMRRCTNRACGMGWLDPMPVEEAIPQFYERYYTHDSAPVQDEVGGEQFPAKSGRLKGLLAALLPGRRTQMRSGLFYLEDMRPGRLLEVGCGAGSFLTAATKAGWQAEGIDFDEEAVAAASAIPDVNVSQASIHDEMLQPGSFDAIVMNNVVEHLPKPGAVFARCAELLRPAGRLVMVTPNLRSLCHAIYGADWRGLETPRHLFLYTDRSLTAFARDAGFSKIDAFSSLSGQSIDFMTDASTLIANRSGRTPPRVNGRWLKIKNLILAALGRNRGEWLVLVARR